MDLDLVAAIKKIAEGKTVLDPQITRTGNLKGERDTGLTPRELEILQHIVAGKSNKEIASELNLSVNTVSVHRANIMDALGIHKTAELVVYAIRNGLVNLPCSVVTSCSSPSVRIFSLRDFLFRSQQTFSDFSSQMSLARPD